MRRQQQVRRYGGGGVWPVPPAQPNSRRAWVADPLWDMICWIRAVYVPYVPRDEVLAYAGRLPASCLSPRARAALVRVYDMVEEAVPAAFLKGEVLASLEELRVVA